MSNQDQKDILTMSPKDYAKAKIDLLSANARQQNEARNQRVTEAAQRKYQLNGGNGK